MDSGTSARVATLVAPLVAVSRRYGADPDWVLAGGGNTSFKTSDRLFVKASGFALADIGPEGFCEMDRAQLDAIWTREYPQDRAAREDAALADLMAARVPGETKRPSVETLLHGFFPQAYVVHTHPALVNGLTCGARGEETFRALFGREAIWVPFVDPGYVLAKTVREVFQAFTGREGRAPSFMLMQNHGLLVAADSVEEIVAISERVMGALKELVEGPESAAFGAELARLAGEGAAVAHDAGSLALEFAASLEAFRAIARPFTPDHIVYAGHEYLFTASAASLDADWAAYRERNGAPPRIVLSPGLGAFAIGSGGGERSRTAAGRAMALFLDSCRIARFARAFGGPRHMSEEAVAFIRNWEVEKYRSSVSQGR